MEITPPCEDCDGTGDMFGGFACEECGGTGIAPKTDYEKGYTAGWNAAIEAVVKKQLDNF